MGRNAVAMFDRVPSMTYTKVRISTALRLRKCLQMRSNQLCPRLPVTNQRTDLGATTITLWPRAARAMGRDPTTSPRPPVLLQGATSAETKTMSRGVSACST